jgi:hypothetical protein
MGIVRAMPDLERWLDGDADSWSALSDPEYKALVRRWSDAFGALVAARAKCLKGGWAMASLRARLPADVYVLSGLPVRQVMNTGGAGPAAFLARGLRNVPPDLANQRELIVASEDFAWSCIFTHEAGMWGWEQLYEADCR